MTGVSIFYNGTDAFYPQPTPFIQIEEDNLYYGELWAKREVVTLQGLVTGCNFDLISAGQFDIHNAFSRNFQNLEIHQVDDFNSGIVYTKELVEIESISFSQGTWRGTLPYTIRLSCYPSGYFSGAFGILDPKDTWSYQEQQNHVAQVTHTVSCRGINTSNGNSDALSNAINWTRAKTGSESAVLANFIEYLSPSTFCQMVAAENLDRFNGTYSITNTYINDLTRSGYGTLRYSATIDSGNNAITVSIQGKVQGGNRDIVSVRNAFNSFDPLGAATYLYTNTFSLTDLNSNPLTQRIDEDPYNASLSFSYVYDNSNEQDVYYDYTVEISSGDNITVSINGNVIARGGDLKSRLLRMKNYAETVNLYQLASPYYDNFYASNGYPLNPKPLSTTLDIDEAQGTLSLGSTYSNQTVFSDALDFFDYTLEIRPSIGHYNFQPTLNNNARYVLTDLGYKNRASLAVRGNARISTNVSINEGTSAIRAAAQQLFHQYGGTTSVSLDENELGYDRIDQRIVSFSFRWSFYGGTDTVPNTFP